MRPVEPLPLDRVVLGAPSHRSLRWAAAERFPAGLLELCGPGRWLLARQGEPLLLPGEEPGQWVELQVLDCSPVSQGLITADTALVLTDGGEPAEPPGQAPPSRGLVPCVSDFAQYADSLGGGGGGRCLMDSRRLLGSGLGGVLQALECRLEVQVVDDGRWAGPETRLDVDADGCVFVCRRLLLRLGLFSREWVKVWWPAGPSQERLVQVQVLDQEILDQVVLDQETTAGPEGQKDHEVGLITRTLWFNMTGGDQRPERSCSLGMKRWTAPPAGGAAPRSDSFCRSAAPPFAAELRLQPVTSPPSSGPSGYDDLLAEHFRTARLVVLGDVLTVPVQNRPDLLENNAEGIPRCSELFFRVAQVGLSRSPSSPQDDGDGGGGGAYLADREHTSLFMLPATSGSAPAVGGTSFWSSQSPPGLGPTVELLSSTVRPYLQASAGGPLACCTVLLHGPAGSGKVTAVSAASRRLNLQLLKVDCVTLTSDSLASSEVKLSSAFRRAAALQPCLLLLRNLHHLLRPRGGGGGTGEDGRVPAALCQLLSSAPSRVVVVATVCRPRDLPASVTAAFVHQVALQSPTEEQRLALLQGLSQDLPLGADVDLHRLAQLTAGLVLGDLSALIAEAGRCACRRLRNICRGRLQEELCCSGVTIRNQDFSAALQTLQDVLSTAIGAPKIPAVRWEDVGGLQQVKQDVLDTVQLPLQRPQLAALGLARTGLLLYGPPGTGKTLLAKAVATECGMTFLSVKGPELLNMYVGQSEENIREVFSRARSAAPCIIFFDELDSLAPSRGRSGDSGGVMDRVVSQLLTELDGLSAATTATASVFVIAATNRPDLLDQSLLRPGRLDKLVYVGINEDRPSQLQVLQAVLRKFQLDSTVDLQEVLGQCPAHLTGADLYALCSDAMMAAIKRKVALIEDGLDSQDSPLQISACDFSAAVEGFQPSVSEVELQRYRNIQSQLAAK